MIPELKSALELVTACNDMHATIAGLIKKNASALGSFAAPTEVPYIKYTYHVPRHKKKRKDAYEYEGWSVNIKCVIESSKAFVGQLDSILASATSSPEKTNAVAALKTHVEGTIGPYFSLDLECMIDNISYWKCFRNINGDHIGLLAIPDVFTSHPETNQGGYHIDVPHLTFHPDMADHSVLQCHAKLVDNKENVYCPPSQFTESGGHTWNLYKGDHGYTTTDMHQSCSKNLVDAMTNTLYILNSVLPAIQNQVTPSSTPESGRGGYPRYAIKRKGETATTENGDRRKTTTSPGGRHRFGGSGQPPAEVADVGYYSSDSDSDSDTVFDYDYDDQPELEETGSYDTSIYDVTFLQSEPRLYTHRAEIKDFFSALLKSDNISHIDPAPNGYDERNRIQICKVSDKTFVYFNVESPDMQKGGDRRVFQFAGIAIGLAMTAACSVISAFKR
jgi:hypothetical protein